MIGGAEIPSLASLDPPYWPWSDSTRPIAAISHHWMPHDGSTEASRAAARR